MGLDANIGIWAVNHDTVRCLGEKTAAQAPSALPGRLNEAFINREALLLETRGPYQHGWAEMLGKLPWASTAATLRVAAAAHAARRWQSEGLKYVGVRTWVGWQGRLWPVYTAGRSVCWSESTAAAQCWYSHSAPHPTCKCGLYAVRPDTPQSVPADNPNYVIGLVTLFGRVIPYEAGWRAERARILEVWTSEKTAADINYEQYPGVMWHVL